MTAGRTAKETITGVGSPASARRKAAESSASPALLRRWILENGRRFSDKVFIHSIDQNKAMTYGQLLEVTERMWAFLGDSGVQADDRIVVLSRNSIEHLAAYVGVMAYGATVCTVHVEMNAAHLDRILDALAPRFVLYQAGLEVAHLIDRAPGTWMPLGDWQPRDSTGFFGALAPLSGTGDASAQGEAHHDACIYFTSGTSATPKGVVLTFDELLGNVEPTADAFGMTASDRILDCRSYNWASAQILSALAPLCKGASVIMATRFSRSRFFGWIRDFGATIAAGNPTMINMLVNGSARDESPDLPTLRFLTSSSAPLLVEEWKRFEDRFGITVVQGYGTSETGWIAGSDERTRLPGSVGRPLPYHKLQIVDHDGRAQPPGEIGFVELGHAPDRQYRYLTDDGSVGVAARGRYRTGDLGFLDREGRLHLAGRQTDLIIRGGVNIAPLEIDNVLMRRPEIAQAATVGIPDAIYGEEVVSYVVVRSGTTITRDAVLTHCREHLPAFKTPKHIVFAADLPKTDRGKMDRKALAEQWRGQIPDAG